MRVWLLALSILICGLTPCSAKQKLALVIGNDAYANIGALDKATADARAYVDLLREKGFRVQAGYDLGYSAMQNALADFVQSIGPGDTVLFVYAGHGWSDGAHNYLVGVDAPNRASQERLQRVSFPLRNGADGILDDFERKGAGLKIAIIDACRDNPFQPEPGRRGFGVKRGLTPESAAGVFTVYSAGEGQSALDSLGNSDPSPNSVFSRTLIPLLKADIALNDAVKLAQEQVHQLASSIGAEQTPAYYDEVLGRTCLSQRCGGQPAEPTAKPQTAGYFIQFASFQIRSNAVVQRDQLNAMLTRCALNSTHIATSDDFPTLRPGWFAVLSGPYENSGDAESQLASIRNCGDVRLPGEPAIRKLM